MSTERSLRSDHGGEPYDTTRYLCAAAHLDDRFTDRVIREFLTEPTRGVPPATGVRAGAVLAEAIAARARRKVRDTLLVVLCCGVLSTLSLSLVIAWVLIAVVVVAGVGLAVGDTRRLPPAIGGGLVAAVLLAVLLNTGASWTSYSGLDLPPAAVIAVALLVALLGVLLADEFVVWRHIEDRFRRGGAVPEPAASDLTPAGRRVYLFGAKRFRTQLRRHLNERQRLLAPGPDDPVSAEGEVPLPAPVIIARGHRMFVGAGEPYGPWSLAIPLRRRPDADGAAPLTARTLYERVDHAMDSLRGAVHLSPGGRFAGLRVDEQIVVDAAGLVDNLGQAGDFLADAAAVPYPLLRGQRVRELRDDPLEWARYYLRFQVETWDRDVVVSVFLHLAVSDTTLYVEWTPCVLLPVMQRYRAIDTMPDSPLRPVAKAVVRFLTLPMTVPARLRTMCSVIRPRRLPPDRYAVSHSLRELAADTDVRNCFQLADRSRYVKVLESRLTLALVEALAAAGYEVAGLGNTAGRATAGVVS
jgi:hypothetical protein